MTCGCYNLNKAPDLLYLGRYSTPASGTYPEPHTWFGPGGRETSGFPFSMLGITLPAGQTGRRETASLARSD